MSLLKWLQSPPAKRARQDSDIDLDKTSNCESDPPDSNVSTLSSGSLTSIHKEACNGDPDDVSNLLKNVNNSNRLDLFNRISTPTPSFNFPTSGKRNLKFQYSWLSRWNWLTYSTVEDGAFCKYCTFFSVKTGGVNSQSLGQLVCKPFSNWKKAIETFEKHSGLEYHQDAILKHNERVDITKNIKVPITQQLDTGLEKMIAENRKKLTPIIKVVLLCGRQNIALRGKKDWGSFNLATDSTLPPLDSNEVEENEGNFRKILRLYSETDQELRNHLENCGKNASYLSPTIQNEILDTCHKIILRRIVKEVNDSEGFSILADESADISGVEQLSLCVRYVTKSNPSRIKEEFLAFVPTAETTGKSLASTILTNLEEMGINCDFMFGQGYDGAKSMSGHLQGAQACIADKFVLAIYVHCAAHSLNLAIADSCNMSCIRNVFGTLKMIYNFFNTPKRQILLQECIAKYPCPILRKKLKNVCPTRWSSRGESVVTYQELQDTVLEALEIASEWKDSATSSTAFQLLKAIKSAEFQISIVVSAAILSVTLPLNQQLQEKKIEMKKAMRLCDLVYEELSEIRESADAKFHKMYQTVEAVCSINEIPITLPRKSAQRNAEDYYRIKIFIPFLDSAIQNLKLRFLNHKELLLSFDVLLSTNANEVEAKSLIARYAEVLHCRGNENVGSTEIKLWQRLLKSLYARKPEESWTAHDLLEECDSLAFPNVHMLLKILCTLPVTTATNERSFSTLRLIKTYLRNTMGENRLNGCASLSIHRDQIVTAEEVLDEMGKRSRRIRINC